MGPKVESWLQDCLHRVHWTLSTHGNQATGKTRSCNVKDVVREMPARLLNVDTAFGRAGKFINHPANFPTIPLNTTKNNITYQKKPVAQKSTLF